MKTLICMLCFCSITFGQSIEGFWKRVSDDGKPQCMIAVYAYKDRHYGKIIGTYDDEGKLTDSIYSPKGRAPGIPGHPYYCGLDFVWNLTPDDDSDFRGKIVDPEKGGIYKAVVWVEDANLIIRGELFFFGQNTTWLPADAADFVHEFKKPDLHKLVPSIPKDN